MSNTVNLSYFGNLEQEFSEHLGVISNERILFSGKFGKGKTTFLKYFFEKNRKQYFAISLSPVHYSVASNQDIIRYLKYDILIELIKNGYSFERLDINKWEALPFFIASKPMKLISSLLHFIPKVGKTLGELNEKIIPFVKELEVFIEENQKKAQGNAVEKYFVEFENEEGSIYENDFLTYVLNEALKHYAKKEKPVLVIDDLDRLDPEHIFRILNVFASQFNIFHNSFSNKFSFEKTIIVCDVNNIRNIFENRYGKNVDYKGYIDKFFSIEPFFYKNHVFVSKSIESYLNTCKISGGGSDYHPNNYLQKGLHCLGLKGLLEELVNADHISLRALKNYFSTPLRLNTNPFVFIGAKISNHEAGIFIETQILCRLLGGYSKTVAAIKDLKDSNVETGLVSLFVDLLKFYNYPNEFYKGKATLDSGYVTLNDKEIKYFFENGKYQFKRYLNGVPSIFKVEIKHYYELVLLIIDELYNNRYLEP
jgi:hypothetical protein